MRLRKDNSHNESGFLLTLDEFCERYDVTLGQIATDLNINDRLLDEKQKNGNYYIRQNQVEQTLTLVRIDRLSDPIDFNKITSITTHKLYLEG